MTGASPSVTDNYFAMALMPVGYKRAYYEPQFHVPPLIRHRLAMTEDTTLDTSYHSFKNWTTGEIIPSIWDQMREGKKKFAAEACVALGVRSDKGITTHGSRPLQLMDKIKRGLDFAYIQISETDQHLHYRGTSKEARRPILKWADGTVSWLIKETEKLYKEVNIVVFGDHGMDDIRERVDIPLEYPPYQIGWDYLYLKSSAAIQFWVFNDQVTDHILRDPVLKKNGRFIDSPSKRQGDIIWRANYGTLVSPCHFHPKGDPIRAMHGWNPLDDNMKGMALIVSGKNAMQKQIHQANLNDICPTLCSFVGVEPPKKNQGRSLI